MAISREALDVAKAQTQAVYERNAAGFDRHRARVLFEAPWLERFAAELPKGGRVLDLGCGTGDPVSGWLLDRGFEVTGLDFSAPMLAIAKERYPAAQWVEGDMRLLDLPRPFDGILSWDGFFHLSKDEQRGFFSALPQVMADKCVLMLTVGDHDGEVTGTVEGEAVYHASLAPDEYKAHLRAAGFTSAEVTSDEPDHWARTVLFGVKG